MTKVPKVPMPSLAGRKRTRGEVERSERAPSNAGHRNVRRRIEGAPHEEEPPVPTLTEVNPEAGSITGGARIWLKGINFTALFPIFARFGSAVVPTVSLVEMLCEFKTNQVLRHSPPATFLIVSCLVQPRQALST